MIKKLKNENDPNLHSIKISIYCKSHKPLLPFQTSYIIEANNGVSNKVLNMHFTIIRAKYCCSLFN
jgi:hypothetical protein